MIDIIIIKKLLLDLKKVDLESSYYIYDPNTNYNIIELYLNKDENVLHNENGPICDKCGATMKIRGSKVTTIKTSTCDMDKVLVNVHRRQYRCSEGHTQLEPNPFTDNGKQISIQKNLLIVEALRDKTRTYTSVAHEFDVSTTYVQNVFDTYVSIQRQPLTEVLCFDEVYSRKLGSSKYCFVIYSPQYKRVVDVLDNRYKLDLIDYFSRIPQTEKKNVKYICIDRWETYRDVAHLCFPDALVACDSFHVIKHLLESFDRLRKRIMAKYAKAYGFEYWILKKFNWMLKKGAEKLDESRQYKFTKANEPIYMYPSQILNVMFTLEPRLKVAYDLKEAYREFNLTASYSDAAVKLEEIIYQFKQAKISEYKDFVSMLERWRKEIVNSFIRVNDYRLSNGFIERLNSDIKTIYKVSYGATNFPRMRNRIMFSINEDMPILGIPKNKTNKTIGKKRNKYKKKKIEEPTTK